MNLNYFLNMRRKNPFMCRLCCGAPFLVFLQLILNCSTTISGSRIELETEGGYTGIAIKIREDVPMEKCSQILKNLESTIRIASGILFDTFDKRPYFKRVTVIVPNGWSDSVCEATIQPPSYPSNYGVPDIFLSPDGDAIYGNHPRTIRSMGCGLSGDFIEFPYSLLSDDRIAARSLVSEWAKYRYGVFEEHGFPGDPYYPVYYERNETLIPSGNTDDRALHGEWKDGCNPQNDKNCYFKYSDTSEIKCSLGFVPFLSNVSGFCHKNNNFDSVKSTKQFTLCQGKSSSQIIHDHKDFQSLSRLFHHPHPESTLVSFVREPIKKYLFFVEASSTVANSGLWKWISKATQNLIRYDLPEGSEISIVTYSNETFVMAKSAILKNNKIRGQLADRMPSKQQVKASSEKSFVSVAFDFIISNKLGLDSSGTKIVIIKRDSDEDGLNREWEQKLINYTRRNQVQFSTILFRDSHHGTIQPSPFYDSLSELSGGKTFVYDLNVQTSSYFNIMSSLKDIIILDSDSKSRNVPRIIHSSVSKGLEPLESSFYVDTFVGKETIFGILVNDAENHKVKSVTFWDESGNSYGPYQSLSSEYNVINMKTINFLQIAKKPPFDDVSYLGKPWKYKVEWFSENSNKYDENVVVVTSKERNPESQRGLVVDVWTSAESSNDKVTDKHPLSIYVRLTHGFRPVANAKVTCQISIMQDVGSLKIVESEVFELFDTGNGDPDIIMNDGIYSRYVTEYHGTGRYQFSIYVENSSKNAFVIKNSGKKFPSPSSTTPLCCGSLVPVEDDLKEPIEPFHRVISGPVVYLLETPSEKEDKMAPNRVLDLKIFHIQDAEVTAEWTAPGDDFDSGNVSSYLFVLMNDKFQVKNTIHELQRSDSYGTKVSTSFDFPIRGKVSYVGLIPIDESGNQGNVSNIVTLLVPLNPATVSPTPPGPLINGGDSNWVTIGIVCGILATLLLLFLILVMYFSRRRRRRHHDPNSGVKSSGVNVDLHHSSDSSSYESDIKNLSSNQLVPTISTISNTYKNNKTSFGHGLTPTYWSASQLLREHEERHSKPQGPSFMGAIAEEEGYYNRALDTDGRYYSSTISPPYDDGIIVEGENDIIINGKAGVPKGSDSSSSTLGVLATTKNIAPSQYGSTLSVNTTKTRNITQV